jgi:hypothetical protein
MKTKSRLPVGLLPRLLCRDAAAAYCGISPNHFDGTIAKDVKPLCVGKRHLWDIKKLDQWIDAQGGRDSPQTVDDWIGNL